MAFAIPKENYPGKVKVVTIGNGDKAIKVGGYDSMPLCTFEGEWPNKPVVAMEVYDIAPDQWPPAVVEPFKDVLSDPGAWAKKCVEYGAELIVVQLAGTDPNGANRSAADAVETVKVVKGAVDEATGELEKTEDTTFLLIHSGGKTDTVTIKKFSISKYHSSQRKSLNDEE